MVPLFVIWYEVSYIGGDGTETDRSHGREVFFPRREMIVPRQVISGGASLQASYVRESATRAAPEVPEPTQGTISGGSWLER